MAGKTVSSGDTTDSYTVPADANTLWIQAQGGKGGDGGDGAGTDETAGGAGGGGGLAEGDWSVSGGENLTLKVGGDGGNGDAGSGTTGGSGGAAGLSPIADAGAGGKGEDDSLVPGGGGGGGGAVTAVERDSDGATLALGEGGGGGGGGGADPDNIQGGGAGGGSRGGLGGDGLSGAADGSDASGSGSGGDGGDGGNGTSAGGAGGGGGATVHADLSNTTTTTGASTGGVAKAIPYPLAVTLDSATVDASNNVDLSWSGGDFEDDLEIHRATSSGFTADSGTRIDTVGPSATSYEDTTADEGTEYHYKIKSVNEAGTAVSNELSAQTDLPAPTAIAVTNTDSAGVLPDDQADVVWTDNATDEVAYRVLLTTDAPGSGSRTYVNDSGDSSPGSTTTNNDLAPDTESYTTTNLLDGEKYWVAIEVVGNDAVTRTVSN